MVSTAEPRGHISKIGRVLRTKWNPLFLATPAITLIVVFGVYPLTNFLYGSISSPSGGLTLNSYVQLLTSGYFFGILLRTLSTALIVTGICLLLAYPTAYALMKARGTGKTVLLALVLLPYLTSVLVRTYAWSALLALNGPVNTFLVHIGVFDKPRLLGHSDFGTGIGMVHILLPIAVLTLWSRLEKIDPDQEVIAVALGASRVKSFATVFFPQSLSGVIGAGTLVYVLALGAYVIPAALGGTNGLLFAQVVADQATQLLNWELAGAMGAFMLIAAALPAITVLLLRRILIRARRTAATITAPQRAAIRWVYPLFEWMPDKILGLGWKIVATVVMAFLIVPEAVILLFSIGPEKQVTFPPSSYTLDGYTSVLGNPSWMEPLGRSIGYAAIDAVLATVVGALAAYGFARGNARWARIGTIVLLLPIVLPEIVMAISYYVFANGVGLAGTDQGTILGQAISAVGLVVVILTAVVREVDVNLEYAAQMSGASRWRVIREIVTPLIIPGLTVAFAYGFLTALDNLVLPLFISGTRPTITVRMFLSMQDQLTSSPAVIASLLIVALMVCIATALIVQRTRRVSVPLPIDVPAK